MNKVDPNLFITCRLCLEELGQYQIVPGIQEKILSCYDIAVNVFDGLPQLICQKCETNLSQHYATKQKYLEKQNSLKQSAASQNAIQEEQLPNLQHDCVNINPPSPKKRKLSSASEETTSSTSWESDYYKKYYCRLCKYKGKNQKYMKYHHGMHKYLKSNYSEVLNRYCYVKLDKFDDKPNKTGQKNTVMFSPNKIILSCSDYIIRYTPRRNIHNREYSDHESGESTRIIPYKRKRILSNSSSDTVVIDNVNQSLKHGKEKNVNYCIQISSDEDESDQPVEKEANELNTDKSIAAHDNDSKTIQSITSNCYSKYLKRIENTKKVKMTVLSSNMESQLNHKVLSIGRKVLNGNYVNCTGLLRFLEYKYLLIMWAPATNISRDSNIVIRTFLKRSSPETLSDHSNWSYVIKTRYEVVLSTKKTDNISSSGIQVEQQTLRNLVNNSIQMPVNVKSLRENNAETKAKILNASPVANPKQMPSKVTKEVNSVSVTLHMADSNINNIKTTDASMDNEENRCSLPVITSTTSLFSQSDKKGSRSNSNVVSSEEISYPRIKVKPVSELMSAKALNSLAIAQAPFPYAVVPSENSLVAPLTESCRLNENQNVNIYRHGEPEGFPHDANNISQTAKNNQPPISSITSNYASDVSKDKLVILDTIYLPNTKTNSPFQYLKNLLQFHNLILLDRDDDTTEKYCCLIKFKVSFRQDTTEPVIFGMQLLYYYNGAFCIKVFDKNQGDIAITTLSADWQWEIIKTLKGDAITKLLANAKKVSKEAYCHTQSFICLLNSIQYKKFE